MKMRTMKLAALGAVVAALASTVARPADNKMPEMPKEIAAVGDPDAVCLFASIDAHARVDIGTKEKSDPRHDEFIEMVMRQLAFYSGKLTAHTAADGTKALMRQARSGYFDKTKLKDTTTAVMWCYQAYVAAAGEDFPARADQSQTLAKEMAGQNLPAIKPEDLDPDSLCYMLVDHAIPGTTRAARTNPDAARSLQNLMRGKYFYIGRLMGAADQAGAQRRLADALRFSIQLEKASDARTVTQPLGTACMARYQDTTGMVLSYGD
jgi:hypothetical protein